MKTNLIVMVGILGIVLFSGCIEEKPIGGETDEHGCLGPAGYTWNEEVGACVREWELNENQRKAAKKVVEHVGYEKGTTVIKVDVARCPGCFAVHLKRDNKDIRITLENWEIINDTCLEMTLDEAQAIAQRDCEGEIPTGMPDHVCNTDTRTWWLESSLYKEGCNPACVVDIDEKTAGINWRCMGVKEINSFDDCVEAGYPIVPPTPGGYTECRTPDGKVFYFEEINVSLCARDGELLRKPDEYCCEGLKEWPIPDTRFSIADVCYEVGEPSKLQMRMCIKCGDEICESHLMYDENPCNCPEDCKGKNKSMFQSIKDFCQSNDWKISLSKMCEETIKDSSICKLC